jgi:hypothetical protein
MSNHTSRRRFLRLAGAGAGGLALGGILPGSLNAAFGAEAEDPLAPKPPHVPAKAKSVIWLHMAGAPSSLDLFDYKPELIKLHGQPLPESFGNNLKTATDGGVGALLATKRTWKQYGETGAWVSDWLPNLATQVDQIAFLKGTKTEGSTHVIEAAHERTDSGSARAGCLDPVRARFCQPGSARVRRAADRRRQCRRRARRAHLELGLPACGVSGHRIPPG